MILFDRKLLEDYEKHDDIKGLMYFMALPEDHGFASQRWLMDSLPKRLIFYYMYHELLQPLSQSRKVLDVGGGYTSLSRLLLKKQDYFLLDILAHDRHEDIRKVTEAMGKSFWINSDWYQFSAGEPYDLVIANDLFPNVDQRLELFIEKFLPVCKEMRLSLTYYNSPRFYMVKRLDADEILCLLAWDGAQVKRILGKYIERIEQPNLDLLLENRPSLFANGRQVCLVCLRGDQR